MSEIVQSMTSQSIIVSVLQTSDKMQTVNLRVVESWVQQHKRKDLYVIQPRMGMRIQRS